MTTKGLVLITGAAISLGREAAAQLLSEGWSVALTDRDGAAVAAAAAALDPSGLRAKAWALDVSDAAQVASVTAQIAAEFGVPDALINNAGIYPDGALLEMDVADWDRVFAVNVRGTFLMTQAFARLRAGVEGQGGTIVNLASTAAYSARVGASHYAASKAAIVMFTKSSAQELAPLGIRVNAVAPGLIIVREDQSTPEYREAYTRMIPRGRVGAAHDIASVLSFLLGPGADFVNGETIAVDGGFLAGRNLVRITN